MFWVEGSLIQPNKLAQRLITESEDTTFLPSFFLHFTERLVLLQGIHEAGGRGGGVTSTLWSNKQQNNFPQANPIFVLVLPL